MKITISPKKAEDLSKYTRVSFEEKAVTLLREREGVQVLVIGRDKKDNTNMRVLRSQMRSLVRTAKTCKIERLAINISDVLTNELLAVFPRAKALQAIVENMFIAHYEFTRYKSTKKEYDLIEVVLCGITTKEDQEAVLRGDIVATYVNATRDLANTPGGDMTPKVLAEGIVKLAKGSRVSVKVLAKREIEKLNMGALLGVSRGSIEDPRFIIMEYWGAGKPKPSDIKSSKKNNALDHKNPIILVGKGITFDTGGLNLKPSDAVLDMHMDMSGGAVVASAIICASRLGLKKNIVALIPAAENMVSGESYRPGDVLTTMSGKTVDVLNTDAEGRLVLADALTYAKRYNPRLVIDVATLTGAAVVALGVHASAIMTKDAVLQETLMRLGEESGDYVWPLPLWNEYKQYTKGVHGDLANIPSSGARYGGSINGGMFLSHFTEDYTWAHIDMAPRMISAPGDHLAKGATGEPVRLLVALAEQY